MYGSGSYPSGVTQHIALFNPEPTGKTLYQSLYLTSGIYVVSFYVAPREYTNANNSALKLTVDLGNINLVTNYVCVQAAWKQLSYTATIQEAGEYVLKFTAYETLTTSDLTLNLTNIKVTQTTVYKSNLKYMFDWSYFLPMGNYKMTYSFSSNQTTTSATTILLSIDDLGIIEKNYTGGNKTAAYITSVIGYINNNTFKTSLISGYKYNSPVYCRTPTNNIFTVKLYTYDGLSLYALTSDYILTLCFEEI
jgi:hypothetical protein